MKFNLVVLALSSSTVETVSEHSLPAHLPLPPHLRKSPSSLPDNLPVPPHLRQALVEEETETTTGEFTTTTSTGATTTATTTTAMTTAILTSIETTPKAPSLLAALLGDYDDHQTEEEILNYQRGTFDLQLALRDSRDKGYGNGVRLRFNGVSKSSLDPIYLCSERPAEHQCCTNKDPHCFTPGGCFCDASCKAFDDCCPDYEDLCVDRSCLEKKGSDPVQTYFRSMRLGSPKNSTENRLPSGGGSPGHVEPDACCGGKPYNHEERCCCNEQITDQCPCKAN